MTCADLPVAGFVDGDLAPAEQKAAERHLQGCPGCRALVADLRTVRAAAFTLDRREPPDAVLARIRAAIALEPPAASGSRVWPTTRGAWAVWMGAAAVLLLATMVGLLPLVTNPGLGEDNPVAGGGAPQGLVDSVESDLRLAEAHYDKAIQGLEQIARGETAELDPQLASVLQKNLAVIDQAIDESRAALRAEPASATAQDGLFEAMRSKVSLLQQTVELINEMRKGNQAEAGRLMQDLSR